MAILPIIVAPDPRLKVKSKPVDKVDANVTRLMDDMLETMYAAPGIGLAAPQIGVPLRVLVLDRPNPIGGLLVGFGARYAGGCTSGHAISGLSDLQIPSLLAVVGFFIGGLLMTHLLFPIIF